MVYEIAVNDWACVSDEKYLYKCPDRLRLPLIFYFAHTASVYINKLILAGLLQVTFRLHTVKTVSNFTSTTIKTIKRNDKKR